MVSEAELDATQAKSDQLDQLWDEIEENMQRYEQEKRLFARNYGIEYDEFLQKAGQKVKETHDTADQETRRLMDEAAAELKEKDEEEFRRLEADYHSQAGTAPSQKSSHPRRPRNMI